MPAWLTHRNLYHRSRCSAACPAQNHKAQYSCGLLGQGTAIRLFKFTRKGTGDSWELYAAAVSPSFYDANEDAASAAPQWFLEAGDLEVEVSDKFSFEEGARRATFAGPDGGIWALRFPSLPAFRAFVGQYNGKLFENTYKLASDDANHEKVLCLLHLGTSFPCQAFPILSHPVSTCAHCLSQQKLLDSRTLKLLPRLQVFGKDTILNMGAQETLESREQWLEDVDMQVLATHPFLCRSTLRRESADEHCSSGRMGSELPLADPRMHGPPAR